MLDESLLDVRGVPGGEGEKLARCNGLEICFEEFGNRTHETLLLVMGLGLPMIAWHDELCEALAASGPFHVVRFDNRDCGRSTHLDSIDTPTLAQVLLRRAAPSYTLEDMAADALGLLDHLGVGSAHVVGASLGGMIAQTLALKRPDRVRSLVSLMSTTGSRRHGQVAPRLLPALLRELLRDRTGYVTHFADVLESAGSRSFAPDPSWLRRMLIAAYDRGFSRDGYRRQLIAGLSAPSRLRGLSALTVPTLVIHGTDDRAVAVSGGRATARAVPGAHLLEIGGMGHDLPRELWPVIVNAVAANARRSRTPA